MASDEEREAAIEIAVKTYAANDYWQLDAEYPTKSREEAEQSIEYARYVVAPVVDALIAAGFHRQGKITEAEVEAARMELSRHASYLQRLDEERSTPECPIWQCGCGQELDSGRHEIRAMLEAAEEARRG